METKIYIADVSALEDEALYKRLYDLMPKERKEKIDGYRFTKDKFLSIGVWALLVHGLTESGMLASKDTRKSAEGSTGGARSHDLDLTLVYGKNEKPFFKDIPAIRFNLSHSGNYAMCIISDVEVGCDIEKKRDKCLDIADRYFFNEEKELINLQTTEDEKKDMFFRLWTLKESYMKVTGLGFRLALNDFSVVPSADGIKLTLGDLRKSNSDRDDIEPEIILDENYTFYEYNVDGPYKASCCIKGEHSRPKLTEVNLKEVF